MCFLAGWDEITVVHDMLSSKISNAQVSQKGHFVSLCLLTGLIQSRSRESRDTDRQTDRRGYIRSALVNLQKRFLESQLRDVI